MPRIIRAAIIALAFSIPVVASAFDVKERKHNTKATNSGYVELAVTNTLNVDLIALQPSYIACRLDSAAAKNVRVGRIASAPTAGNGYALEPGDEWIGHYVPGPAFIADTAGAVNVWCYYELQN